MSSVPFDEHQPGVAVSDADVARLADVGRLAEDTAAGAHDLTPRRFDPDVTRSFRGSHAADSPEAREQFGRYRVLGHLGQGAFATVWLAADDELQRQVALKVIAADRLATADEEAYLAEARALAALDHPHIVPVYDVGRTDDGSLYVVSKSIEGATLRQHAQDRRCEPGEAAGIVATLAEAVHHAHERNLIHRDIKPANILIEAATGRVYLADFGLAIRPANPAAGDIAGTPAYMSPEQSRNEPLDGRSDLFSLGVVLYELLTGERPFQGLTLPELLSAVGEGRFVPIGEVAEPVPAELAQICHRLLAKERDDRYSTGLALATALRTWKQRTEAAKPAIPHNLPASAGPLVGRDREVDEVQRRITQSRLLTLVGPGGIGKTSLAIQAAEGFVQPDGPGASVSPDGVFFVELAPLSDPALVCGAIARAVGCGPRGQRPVIEELLEWLASRRVLLVLDNFEHLPAASVYVARLLAASPDLRVLATSRAPLHIAGEQEFPVSLLSLPDPGQRASAAELAQCSAVALFVQRAQAVLPNFELTSENAAAVAEICERMDGLPLAIELAAARIKVLPPQSLLERLRSGRQVLAARHSDVPQRQQTLRQAIAWSYGLLPAEVQLLFGRLAVFSGGFTLEAAEQVVGAEIDSDVLDCISTLADNSLVQRSLPDGSRFNMLQTVREFAREVLASGTEADAVGRRHAQWLVQLVETADPALLGAQSAKVGQQIEQEHANVRAALAWCLADPADCERGTLGLRLAGALWRFWCTRGYLHEAHDWLSRLLAAFGETHQDSVGAKARYAAGCIAEDLGDFHEARRLYEEARGLWERVGDGARLADAHIALGSISSSQGEYAAADESFQRALVLSQKHNDRRAISVALSNLGSVAWSRGDYDLAKTYHDRALAIRRELGNRAGVAVSLTSLGLIASRRGDLDGACVLYNESLAIVREMENQPGIAVCLNNLGEIHYRLGEFETGESLLWEALRIQHQIGDRLSLAYTLESLAAAAQLQGSCEAAVRFFAAAEALRETLGAPLPPLEKASNDQIVQEVRLALGPERFIALWTAAKTVPLERLVDEAPAIAHGERRE